MALSKITTKGILDGTIATADLADNAVNSAKIGADVIVADDVANNAITTAEITDGAITAAKINSGVALGLDAYMSLKSKSFTTWKFDVFDENSAWSLVTVLVVDG